MDWSELTVLGKNSVIVVSCYSSYSQSQKLYEKIQQYFCEILYSIDNFRYDNDVFIWCLEERIEMFFKKEDKFAALLIEMSQNIVKSMDFFAEYAKNDENGLKDFATKMKDYEHKGDSFVHTIIHDLNKVFITPIEREDILALAMRMDDVIDGLDSTSALFEMYGITRADEFMLQFVDAIHNAVVEIDKAVALIDKKKLPQIRKHAIRIKECESKCDDILRASIKNLFQHSNDPILIMQYKEIYEEFEGVADSCEDVANTLEAIIMKNA